MLRIPHFVFLLAVLSMSTGCSTVGSKPDSSKPTKVDSGTYQVLLAAARVDLSKVDFTALRLAYTETTVYHPYLGLENALNTAMFSSLQAEQFDKAMKLAQQLLESNYVSLDGHYVAWQSFAAQGASAQALYHRGFLDGLLESISTSGDGVSAETAYRVISNAEMYAFLGLHALEPRGQAVLRIEPNTYNRVNVVDADRNRKDVFFDISLQVNRGIAPNVQ